MKTTKANLIIITICILIFTSNAYSESSTLGPHITLKEAISIAEEYVTENKLIDDTVFLFDVRFIENEKDSAQNCWRLIWAPKDRRVLDGETRIYIFMDGTIKYGQSA